MRRERQPTRSPARPASPRRRIAALAGVPVAAGVLAIVVGGPAGDATGASIGAAAKRPNLCLDKEVREDRGLKCPDLRMRPPYDLDRAMVGSRPVLRAANSINSVGKGPAELRGSRSGPRLMDAHQRIRKKGGRMVRFRTGAKLYFKSIPGQGRYWKFRDAARFALWLLQRDGDRVRRVEVGPKQSYCLRDLERTHPGIPNSPRRWVYPACSQDAGRQRVKLGTSVGWSDIYPYTYNQNWIELDDIPERGCYAFVHIADPENGIYELNERNNAASTVVYLTPSGRYKPKRCRGVRDQGLRASQTIDDSELPGGGGGGGPYRGPAPPPAG
jgi:Lysyl oxidase